MRSICCILISSLILSSCLRYTPSRTEISGEDYNEIEMKEAFFSFEDLQKTRLEELLDKRVARGDSVGISSYNIGSGDVLQINVFDVEELNTSVRVRPDGNVALPLLGNIKAKGLTEEEFQKVLAKKLEEFLHFPQVSVFIEEYAAHRVSVIGKVAKPGVYPLKRSDYSLIELLSEAGGRSKSASGRIILIPARGEVPSEVSAAVASARAKLADERMANRHGIEIYFDDLVGGMERDPLIVPLRPGDTIVVPEAGTVEVDGEVEEPGSYPLSSRLTLLGTIASAGGLTYSADVHVVEVIRELNSGKKALVSFDLEKLTVGEQDDVRIRDGDVVRVPSHSGRFATRQVVEAVNALFSVGSSVK